MTSLPDSVLRIAEQADRDYPDDIDMAAAECQRLIKELPGYRTDIVPLLIDRAVRELVYDSRHRTNTRINRETADRENPRPHPRPKVIVGQSQELERLYESVYNLRIAGMTLGAMNRTALQSAAEAEKEISDGHLFNSMLCARLVKLLKDDNTPVRQAVPEGRLQKIMTEVRRSLTRSR